MPRTIVCFLLAAGLLRAQHTETLGYIPVKRYSFPANSEAMADAQRRAELIALLADSIEASAQHKVDEKRERRIQKLMQALIKTRILGHVASVDKP